MNIPLESFDTWLRQKNLKERSIENYIYYFNKFTYLTFDQESISKFLSFRVNRNSIGRSFLVNFQKFLMMNYKELGLTQEARFGISEVELPKLTGRKKTRLITPIPHEQIASLEKVLETEKEKLELLLNYYCALRLGELLKIRIIDFNWEEWGKNPERMGECRVFGKGDKEGIALIPSDLMKRIGTYIKGRRFPSITAYLFIQNDNKPIDMKNRGRLWELKLAQAGMKAGLTKLDENGTPIEGTIVHPHRLRHSYASYLLNVKRLNIREVQEILRHTNIQSTQIYTHIDKENLKERLSNETKTNS